MGVGGGCRGRVTVGCGEIIVYRSCSVWGVTGVTVSRGGCRVGSCRVWVAVRVSTMDRTEEVLIVFPKPEDAGAFYVFPMLGFEVTRH